MKKDNRRGFQGLIPEVIIPVLTVFLLFVFRIIVSNRIGVQANGYVHIVLVPVIFFIMILYLPFERTESNLIRARIQKEQFKNSGQVLKYTMLCLCLIGLFLAAVSFGCSEYISTRLIGDNTSGISFRYIALIYLLVPCITALHGYFRGNHMDQIVILNRFIFLLFCLISIIIFVKNLETYGAKVAVFLRNSMYIDAYKGAGTAFGILFACFLSLLLAFVFFLLTKTGFRRKMKKDLTKSKEQPFPLCGLLFSSASIQMLTVLLISLPIILYLCIMISQNLNTASNHTITYDYGIFFGQFLTIWMLPFLLSLLLSRKVTKSVEEHFLQKDAAKMKAVCGGEMNVQAVLASVFSGMQIIMAKPMCQMFYGEQVNDRLILYVRIGGILVFTSTLALTSFRLLWGIRRHKQQMISLAIASVVQMIAVVIASFGCKAGFEGLLISEIIFTVVLFALQIFLLIKYLRYHQEWIHSIVFPVGLGLASSFIGWLIAIALDSPLGDVFSCALAVCIVIVIYLILMFKMIGFRKKELVLIPGGKTILAINNLF